MTNTTFLPLWLAGSDSAAHYQPQALDEGDRQRLNKHPALAQRADWQVSRFLKQQAAAPVLSLSHSRGAALLAAGSDLGAVGVDIEYLKPRDFAALAQWCCSPQERQWLSAFGWQAEAYYRLWCLKEAMIKAAGLSFPADLPQAGLRWQANGGIGLYAAGQAWQGVSARCGDWVLAAVWQAEKNLQPQWNCLGRWPEPEGITFFPIDKDMVGKFFSDRQRPLQKGAMWMKFEA